MKEQIQPERCAEELGDVGRHRHDLGLDPHPPGERTRPARSDRLGQVLVGDDPELGRQVLDQHRDRGSPPARPTRAGSRTARRPERWWRGSPGRHTRSRRRTPARACNSVARSRPLDSSRSSALGMPAPESARVIEHRRPGTFDRSDRLPIAHSLSRLELGDEVTGEAIVGVEPTVPEGPREGRERERGMARAVMAPATPIAVVDVSSLFERYRALGGVAVRSRCADVGVEARALFFVRASVVAATSCSRQRASRSRWQAPHAPQKWVV